MRDYAGGLDRDDAAGLYALTLGRREADFVPDLASRLDLPAEEVRSGLEQATLPLTADLSPMPFAAEVVSQLRADGRRIAVATSSSAPFARAALDRVGVGALVDVLVTGDEVERGKPDPEIYLLSAHRLGEDPAACVAIEDTPAGVAAAKAAGMACVGFPSTGRTRDDVADADHIISSLADLTPDTFRRLIELNAASREH